MLLNGDKANSRRNLKYIAFPTGNRPQRGGGGINLKGQNPVIGKSRYVSKTRSSKMTEFSSFFAKKNVSGTFFVQTSDTFWGKLAAQF